jgi:hypothetical protein
MWGMRGGGLKPSQFLVRLSARPVVILREGGGSSTPRLFDSITGVREYWITRFRG